MRAAPGKKARVVVGAFEIGARPVGHMRLGGALHRMIAGIDARHGGDRAELADGRIGGVAIIDDVGVVAERDLQQLRARADLAICADPAVAHIRGRIDERRDGKLFRHQAPCAIAMTPFE
jgi:hypothetical protein